MNKHIIAKSGSISLVSLDPQRDAGILSAWQRNSAARLRIAAGICDADAADGGRALTAKALDVDVAPVEYHFAVLVGESEARIGLVHFLRLGSSRQAAWLDIEMANDENLNGKAGETIALALRVAFIDLFLHRVCVNLPSFMEAEIALYEEAGFLRETQRRQAIWHAERLHDELVYGMLRSEWLKLSQEVEV